MAKRRVMTKSMNVEGTQTRCPKCLSIKRTKYHRVITRQISGVLRNGQTYDHIVWRRTKCLSCNQGRTERAYERAGILMPGRGSGRIEVRDLPSQTDVSAR
ncbi:hypothetical protein [Novipirellula rosea]|uniref:hypothetical protein n=1 Tax=Novipirellula rosea TaxID=1031540 RepID=UPI0031E5C805